MYYRCFESKNERMKSKISNINSPFVIKCRSHVRSSVKSPKQKMLSRNYIRMILGTFQRVTKTFN